MLEEVKSLKDAILSSEVVSYNNYREIHDYMETLPSDFIAPYNVSPTWLLDEYRLVRYNGMVLTLKVKNFVGNKICEFNSTVPKKELPKFILNCLELGVNVRVQESERQYLQNRQFSFPWKKADTCKGDFVYSKSNNLSTSGGTNESLRRGFRYLDKAGIELLSYPGSRIKTMLSNHYFRLQQKIYQCMDEYVQHKKAINARKGYTFHLKKYIENLSGWVDNGYEDLFCLNLYSDIEGTVYAYSISEKINKYNVAMPDRKNILHKLPNMHQSFLVVNWHDINHWCNVLDTEEIFFNFGNAGGNKTLYENKQRMRPHCILQIYKIDMKSENKLDEDIREKFFNKTGVSKYASEGDERSSLWD